MDIREKVFEKFGPELLEAFFLDIHRDLNELRRSVGLPEKTTSENLYDIFQKYTDREPFEFLKDTEP